MNHTARITDTGKYGAWADCSCGWASAWFPIRTQANTAREAHYLTADDPDIARQLSLRGRRFPDPREHMIDRCTCGGWRWAGMCTNKLCNTNLLEATA